jgi:hypothetical protein
MASSSAGVRTFLSGALIVFACGACSAPHTGSVQLVYAPAPVDNPLKGLVPYAGDRRHQFPHSMEFSYLPLSAVVVGEDEYDWSPLETLLDEVASRGHQTVFRFFLEYPDRESGIPTFLLEDGLLVHRWVNEDIEPVPPSPVVTPDYADPRLRQTLVGFIHELGRRYDGDPRVAFITAGLLGLWGEWHDYPREELFAAKNVQREVLTAYEEAFDVTPILLRTPAGPSDSTYAPNHDRGFGYHDDSFCWATLDTGRVADSWYFEPRLKSAGTKARNKWKHEPIGGEIRPEAWGIVFDPPLEQPPEIQDFRACVEETHATWLMDSGMFTDESQPAQRRERALEEVRLLGYELHVREVELTRLDDGKLSARITLENLGVAPFYYNWTPELGLLNDEDVMVARAPLNGRIDGLVPGTKRTFNEVVPLEGFDPGGYRLLLRVSNPLPAGLPLRFANREQDRDVEGWLTLGELELPRVVPHTR